MNIIFLEASFPPPFVGGKEKQLYLLTNELVSKGVSVQVVSKGIPSELEDGGMVKRFKSNFGMLCFFIIYLLKSKEKELNFYINTPSRIGQYVLALCALRKSNIIFKVSSEAVVDFVCGNKPYNKFITSRISCFHVLSSIDYDRLLELGISKDRVMLSYNGVELSNLPKYKSSDKKTLRFIFSGRVDNNKNLLGLIKAVQKLSVSHPNICISLGVCGDGPVMSECVNFIKLNNIDNIIKLYGFINPELVLDHLLAADALVLPSYSEGMSNTLLEAASIGLPIICSRVGGYQEILGCYSDYLTFDPLQDGSIYDALVKYLSISPENLKEYGGYLNKRCNSIFSINSAADRIINYYAN